MAGHVDEFAAHMAELKERSGRSYGALAGRLHVSTSTLHRYCNGAAVPGEYAPVERFARLCGATPEELVTLHRRWLLADAERREAGAGQAAAAVPVTGSEESTVEFAETPESTPAPETAEAVVTDPEVQPSTNAAARPAGSAQRRSRRRLLIPGVVAAAAVAMTAIAVPLAVQAAQSPTSGGSATRAPGAPTAKPSPTEAALPDPLTVDVLADNWDSECDQWFYTPLAPAKVPPPPGLPDVPLWVAPVDAVPADHLRLQVTAQGTAAQPPVVLHTMYVHVVAARPAPKGYGYTMGSGCGGGLTPAAFAIDLDASSPQARAVPGEQGAIPTPAVDFPFQVSASDSQVLDVDAGTADQDVSWYLEVVWSCGDRQGRLKVDDHGKPFETIGLKGTPRFFYDGREWAPATDS